MNDTSSLTAWLASLDPVRTTALALALIAASVLAHYFTERATRHGRARAREAARAWAETRRTIWDARAEARAERVRQRESDAARAERRARRGAHARMAVVAVVAIAATNLSAHAIQAGLADLGLSALDTRVSVFIVFEGVLAAAAGLSWWHQTTGRPGLDRYRIIVWAMAALMAYLAWSWSGDAVNGLWPLIAAGAWHEVVAAEARRRTGRTGLLERARARAAAWRRARFGTSTDVTETARRVSLVERRAYRANTASPITRRIWERLYFSALDAAETRGLLDDDARARIAQGCASRYAGPGALAPGAVAPLNPWTRALAPAPDVPAVAEAPAEPAPASRALAPVQAPPDVPAPGGARSHIESRLTGPTDADLRARVVAFLADHWADHEAWPTGRALAEAFDVHPATGRKWVASIKAA